MSPLTTPFPRYVGNLANAMGEGDKKREGAKEKSQPSLLTEDVVILKQNLKEETKMVIAKLQVNRWRPQRQFACLCTKNELVGPLTTYSSTPKNGSVNLTQSAWGKPSNAELMRRHAVFISEKMIILHSWVGRLCPSPASYSVNFNRLLKVFV